jgi:oligoendopeptidase F
MKKVLIVVPHLSTGGLPQYTLKQIQSFLGEYDFYCVEWSNISGVEFVVQRNKISNLLGNKFYSLGENKDEIASIIESIQPDIIHFQEIPETFIPSNILDVLYFEDRWYNIVVTTHSSNTNPETISYTADKFILVSEWSREVFTKVFDKKICDIWEYPIEKISYDKNLAKEKLGFDVLKPWDTEAEPAGVSPLKPFTTGQDLYEKTVTCFEQLDPFFAACLRKMNELKHFDLESRKGKAPGGYNCPLAESGAPFIFMNAASQMSDVTTMVHEGGHAVHSFLAHHLELSAFKEYPMEIAEVASMAMELFSMNHWQAFFDNDADLKRAREHQLERTITIFPCIAIIDKFQHWVYENPSHTVAERTATWTAILKEFSTNSIDYTGLDAYREIGWQRQLHLFEVPFYYIEYGIAQLGAIGLWMQYQKNPKQALQNYINALSLGGTKTLPELYKAAGLEFNLSPDYIKTLMEFTAKEM